MPPRAPKKPIAVTAEPWEGQWHLDKRVPVALIISMLAQAMVGVWWASTLAGDVRKLQDEVQRLHDGAEKRDTKLEGLISLRSDVSNLVTSFDRLERTIERVLQQQYEDRSKVKK